MVGRQKGKGKSLLLIILVLISPHLTVFSLANVCGKEGKRKRREGNGEEGGEISEEKTERINEQWMKNFQKDSTGFLLRNYRKYR